MMILISSNLLKNLRRLTTLDKLSKMQSEWLAIHDNQYKRREENSLSDNPLSDKSLTNIYKERLREYFDRYPDQMTDYYHKLIHSR